MKHSRLISLAAMLCTAILMPSSVSSAIERIDIDLTQWTPPDSDISRYELMLCKMTGELGSDGAGHG
jgi:hypothetical protein